MLNQSTLSY